MQAYLLRNGRVIVGNVKKYVAGHDAPFKEYRRSGRVWLVEKWGTTGGLAELANGPTAGTVRHVVRNVDDMDVTLSIAACPKAWALPVDASIDEEK